MTEKIIVIDEYNKEKPLFIKVKEESLKDYIKYWQRAKNILEHESKTKSKKKLKRLELRRDQLSQRIDSTLVIIAMKLKDLDNESNITDEIANYSVMFVTYKYVFGNIPIQIIKNDHVDSVLESE